MFWQLMCFGLGMINMIQCIVNKTLITGIVGLLVFIVGCWGISSDLKSKASKEKQ